MGAIVRYGIGKELAATFPVGTLFINLTGSLALGFLLTWLSTPTDKWRLLLGTGFLGAYTTFSTFSYETLRLFEQGQTILALCYSFASLGGGLLAVWLGFLVAKWSH